MIRLVNEFVNLFKPVDNLKEKFVKDVQNLFEKTLHVNEESVPSDKGIKISGVSSEEDVEKINGFIKKWGHFKCVEKHKEDDGSITFHYDGIGHSRFAWMKVSEKGTELKLYDKPSELDKLL